MDGLACTKCGELKAIGEYYPKKTGKYGVARQCKDCVRGHVKDFRANQDPDYLYWTQIKTSYGLTREEFEAILEAQGGGCAICKTKEPGKQHGRWVVDHDHACCADRKSCGSCIRGLLCTRCNVGLGSFGDDTASLLAAVEYLGEFNGK